MIRVDGDIEPLDAPPFDSRQISAAVAAIGPESSAALETDFCIDLADVARFRVNAFRHQRGAGAVFRTVPSLVPSMEELDMGPVFRQIADVQRGLVLVTGPTGSGKSTTLAALIDYVNDTRRNHILTIEDPVEFVHNSKRCLVHQRQLGRDTASFADALRAGLREDPDVILIGEMRDPETIRLALTAAETGHLVFGHAAHLIGAEDHRPDRGRLRRRRKGERSLHARGIAAGGGIASVAKARRRRPNRPAPALRPAAEKKPRRLGKTALPPDSRPRPIPIPATSPTQAPVRR